jgi:hypothetical protein
MGGLSAPVSDLSTVSRTNEIAIGTFVSAEKHAVFAQGAADFARPTDRWRLGRERQIQKIRWRAAREVAVGWSREAYSAIQPRCRRRLCFWLIR